MDFAISIAILYELFELMFEEQFFIKLAVFIE
jgi:hypothetical protein